MKFRTEVPLPTSPFSLSHKDRITSFGSCFSENIGEKLEAYKFDVYTNPYGILFNPVSISKAIRESLDCKLYTATDLHHHNEKHFSFNHHSKYSGIEKVEVLEKINSSISRSNSYLKKSKALILTLGTAWVYRLIETNEVVANCYKLPGSLFTKELLSVKEIVAEVSDAINKLRAVNPDLTVITTISPVRHWKDGVVENQQSKGTLHLALKGLNEQFQNLIYFPSYEILLDELRDYRFYSSDMLHPSELAIDFIWEKFADAFLDKETKALNKRISQIEKEKSHKPFNPASDEFITFRKQLDNKEKELYLEFPFLKK